MEVTDPVVPPELAAAARLRAELRAFLGVSPPSSPPHVEVLSSAEEDGYVRHLVHLVTDDDTIPCLLAVPSGDGPFPGVIVFHQHAGQRHLGKSEAFGLVGDTHQAFAPTLARCGFVVLAPDSVAFEDRRPAGAGTDERDDDWQQHYNAFTYRLVVGDTLMRKVLSDAMNAVSALEARADVLSGGVAVVGHSYGGNIALFLAAVDDRVSTVGASGALASYRRKISDQTGIEMAEVVPGFVARFDMEHVLAVVAASRRGVLVVSAAEDKYSVDAQEVIDAARLLIGGDLGSLTHLRFEGGHALDADRFTAIVDWVLGSASGGGSR